MSVGHGSACVRVFTGRQREITVLGEAFRRREIWTQRSSVKELLVAAPSSTESPLFSSFLPHESKHTLQQRI